MEWVIKFICLNNTKEKKNTSFLLSLFWSVSMSVGSLPFVSSGSSSLEDKNKSLKDYLVLILFNIQIEAINWFNDRFNTKLVCFQIAEIKKNFFDSNKIISTFIVPLVYIIKKKKKTATIKIGL